MSETEEENDENTPVNDDHPSVFTLHSRPSHDTALCDITDQFFHPPSPSPVRVKRPAPPTVDPPRRPKKPKSLAYPADPPNWLYSRSSSSLPPSSPLPPSTGNIDYTHGHATTARYEYNLGTSSDSDPFGFVAVERAIKAKRTAAPRKPASRLSAVKSPPRSTVLTSRLHAPTSPSFSQLDAPIPTNNVDIDGLYADEPVAGPSHVRVPVAPLLMMNSDQPRTELDAIRSQATFLDPLRTPRKRKRRASLTPDEDPDPDEEGIDSPSPVKISVTHRGSSLVRPSPALKTTRARTRATGAKPPKHVKTSYQHIPTPSSTSARQSTAPSTPVPLRRSTRQAAAGSGIKPRGGTSSDGENEDRMKLRPRSTKPNVESKPPKRTVRVSSKPKVLTKTRKETTEVTVAKPTRGRPKGKPGSKAAKGKGKTRPLENVLDLSDDTRERYDKERRERIEYFKRLEGYQIQKENVYVV